MRSSSTPGTKALDPAAEQSRSSESAYGGACRARHVLKTQELIAWPRSRGIAGRCVRGSYGGTLRDVFGLTFSRLAVDWLLRRGTRGRGRIASLTATADIRDASTPSPRRVVRGVIVRPSAPTTPPSSNTRWEGFTAAELRTAVARSRRANLHATDRVAAQKPL